MGSTIFLAGLVLTFSGLLQLATTWIQTYASDKVCQCSATQEPTWLNKNTTRKVNYSWKDSDFPPTLDLASSSISPEFSIGDPVTLVMEDSRHYTLGSPTDLELDAEWESLYPGDSAGFIRLGPERRFFGLSMYHQLHCLDALRYAIQGREHVARGLSFYQNGRREDGALYENEFPRKNRARAGAKVHVSHTAHCLNYLRQTILCASDLTLEPELTLGSLDVGSGLGATHICRDWSKVHSFVEKNARDYKQYEAEKHKEENENVDR